MLQLPVYYSQPFPNLLIAFFCVKGKVAEADKMTSDTVSHCGCWLLILGRLS